MSILRTPSSRYTKLLSLGKGGMGEAHLAVSTGGAGVQKACVLKVLNPQLLSEPIARKLFFHEAQVASKLDHPKIVCTYDFGEDDDGNFFLAMEYVHGQPWSRVRAQLAPQRLPLVAHVRVLRDLLDALDYAHDFVDFDDRALDVVHRDVAPGNLMVDYSGRVKLLDFGIAKSVDSRSLFLGPGFKGKLGYVSPEQIAGGRVDRRADLYAVAAMLWESIARRKRSEGEVEDILAARVRGTEPKIEEVVPDVDRELAAICARGLAVRPRERFATATEMASAFDAWLDPREGEAPRKEWAVHIRAKYEEERRKVRKILLETVGALADAPYSTGSFATLASLFPSGPPPALTRPPRPPRLPVVSDSVDTVVMASGLARAEPRAEESGESLDPHPTTLSAPAPPMPPPARRGPGGWLVAVSAVGVVAAVAVAAGAAWVFAYPRPPSNPIAAHPPGQEKAGREEAPPDQARAPGNGGMAPAPRQSASVEPPPALTPPKAPAIPHEVPHDVPHEVPPGARRDTAAPGALGRHSQAGHGSPHVAPPTAAPASQPEPAKAAPPPLSTTRPLDESDPYGEKTRR